ncbi:uncharacterized protein KY384_007136 [Bacidia gigantensis]|uniref:uncharacterized protein n=1 Tax=Bacidia gigantensis TaxID=2732470 RepID=UPI001D053F8B|nr:uncharacterized protein KY384_007136 [Bacidia gigantensis]KAG8528219.1 hypothetical protein KY384_007136 [Bacidia gigantensis]
MPLLQLTSARTGLSDESVDIVAVHGIDEHIAEAWTDIETGILWLRDLLPHDLPDIRVLSFGYNAHASAFFGKGSADRIQQHAQTLVAELQADRSLEGCTNRPIIFVCHGLGGLLVKKALTYSSTRTSKHVEHLYSIFVSTFAILFFGTPHQGMDTNAWLASTRSKSPLSRMKHHEESPLLMVMGKECETLLAITEQFMHLLRQFHIFFLWEEIETFRGEFKSYIVEESSAAPILDHTERVGIYANHAQMIQFTSRRSSSYRTVVEGLKRYCTSAPPIIDSRWKHAMASLALSRTSEAAELAGLAFDVHNANRPYQIQRIISEKPRNRFFRIPQAVSSIFTGREDVATAVQDAFWSSTVASQPPQQQRYIIYGIGGSGKTQFCSKFAQDHREKLWGVFWIDATSSETAKHSFSMIGKMGGMEGTESAGKHWLSSAEEPWLLIINNADDPTLELATLFPEGERGLVLVTTRNPFLRVHGSAGSKEFRGLEEKDAIHLLLRAADAPKPWDYNMENLGQKIADTLGYLALALVQAGALILQRMCSMHNYLEYYQEYRQRVRSRRMSIEPKAEDQSAVYATWEHSLDSLGVRGAEADQVLTAAKFGYVYLECGRLDNGAKLLCNVKDALIASRGYSNEKTMVAMLVLAEAYWMLGRLDEAIDLQKKVAACRTSTYGPRHKETLSAMERLGRSYWLNGQYKEALTIQTRTVDKLKFEFGDRNEITLTAMDNLGLTYGSWRRFQESRELHRQVLEARKEILGPSHSDTLFAMNNLAMALKDLGHLKEAESLMLEAYEQRKRKLGKEHPWTLWAVCNLAKVKTELGLLQEAREILVVGIAAGKRSLGDFHLGVLIGIAELSRVYARQKRLVEATKLLNDVVSHFENHRGVSHPDSVLAMHKLALLYQMQGNIPAAINVCQKADRVSQDRLPEEHPLVQDIHKQLQELNASLEGSSETKSSGRAASECESQGPNEGLYLSDEHKIQTLRGRRTM